MKNMLIEFETDCAKEVSNYFKENKIKHSPFHKLGNNRYGCTAIKGDDSIISYMLLGGIIQWYGEDT